MLGIALAAQAIRRRSARLNCYPGDALQVWAPVQHLGGLAPRAIQQHERWHSVWQPRTLTQTPKERCIALRNQQIGHESALSQEGDKPCRRCGTIPWEEACLRDTRTYQTGGVGRLETFVGVNEQPELGRRVNRRCAYTNTHIWWQVTDGTAQQSIAACSSAALRGHRRVQAQHKEGKLALGAPAWSFSTS
jgi:hypothetical protein